MDNRRISFTAANSLPLKLCKHTSFLNGILHKKILPIHIQLNPTNKCNLRCSFCSCKNVDRDYELTKDQLFAIIVEYSKFGCDAITITGGGEPLMHPDINWLIQFCNMYHIQVGLVSNGLLLDNLTNKTLENICWCRISCADERKINNNVIDTITRTVKRSKNIDWAFSYVVSKNYDKENLKKYVLLANEFNFTHVRVVSDLIDLDNCVDIDKVKDSLSDIDDSIVIYQGRKSFDAGQKECFISLLKPVIGADGKIYPCCGVQYAHKKQDLSLPKDMSMGNINDISLISKNQFYFNGSECYRCYYKNYNEVLGVLVSDIKHENFL